MRLATTQMTHYKRSVLERKKQRKDKLVEVNTPTCLSPNLQSGCLESFSARRRRSWTPCCCCCCCCCCCELLHYESLSSFQVPLATVHSPTNRLCTCTVPTRPTFWHAMQSKTCWKKKKQTIFFSCSYFMMTFEIVHNF